MNLNIILSFLLTITVCQARNAFPDLTDSTFQAECLKDSNHYRGLHQNTPALKIDQAAVDYAKKRCNLISQYEGLSHGHAGLKGYGENLYWGGSSSYMLYSCSKALKAWYDEVKKYDFKNPAFSSATGHFTQLVWKSTTGVGCARCGGKGAKWYETYVVCSYSPPGNIVNQGYFKDNVLPLKA